MSQVKSTYNFVPAPEEHEVFKPTWADHVSHDIPFEDGESGEIEIEIKAETPIFIREGISAKDALKKQENGLPFDFSHYFDQNGNKHFFIPATSLKGLIRSNVEILSLSRMNQVDGSKFFGLRDMNNRQYKTETNQSKLESGWLKKVGNEWHVYPVEHVRIAMNDIERKFNLPNNSISKAENALAKYALVENKNIVNQKLSFKKELIKTAQNRDTNYGKLYSFDENGTFLGDLVLYGSISNKHYDFVFAKESEEKIEISTELISKMDTLEKDSKLWLFHKKSNRIPIFYKKEGSKIKHFGLSKLYRLNNGHYLNELQPLKDYDLSKKLDLALIMFGHSNDDNKLKGRLYISNAKHIENKGQGDMEERILSTPNPSYYPYYLKQESNEYSTYINSNSSLKGFKRYPVHTSIKAGDLQKDSMSSKFKPLNAGNKFSFKIRYHNLKPVELGALYSALTFHNTENTFHTLGGGKPYGFGKISIKLFSDDSKKINYLYAFESEMEKHFETNIKNGGLWINSNNVKELIANAKNSNQEKMLVYPQLELAGVQTRDQNEFNNIKKNNEKLNPHSTNVNSLTVYSSKNDFSKLKAEFDRANIEESSSIKQIAEELLLKNNFDKAIEKYAEAMKIYDDNSITTFIKNVNSKKSEKEELDAYNIVVHSDNTAILTEFINKYPFSKYKEEIAIKLRSKEAILGVPSIIKDKLNLKQFSNNTDNWVKKIGKEGETIKSLGFEEEHINQLYQIYEIEKTNPKLLKEWSKYKRNFINWYGEEKSDEIIKKLGL